MAAPTPLFTSARERRLWLWSLAVVAAIYSTLGLAGSLAARMPEDNLMSAAVFVLMILTVATIVGSGLRRRPGRRELWVGLGLTAVYGMAVLRMGVGPEERTHLFEYGVVAVLIYQALHERARGGAGVRVPALSALVVTALLGWLDEGIQALLPNRVYDNFDVLSNAIAALIGIAGSVAIGWVNAALDRRGGNGT